MGLAWVSVLPREGFHGEWRTADGTQALRATHVSSAAGRWQGRWKAASGCGGGEEGGTCVWGVGEGRDGT